MARKAIEVHDVSIRLSARWQATFVAVVLCSFLSNVVLITLSYTRHGQYIGLGTWVYQLLTWIYPILYLLIGLRFAWHRAKSQLASVFMGTLLAVIGTMAYDALNLVFNIVHYHFFNSTISSGNNWWNAFGLDWTFMAVCLIAFATLVWLVDRKSKIGSKI